MNDAMRVKVLKSVEDLFTHVRDPVLSQRASLHRLDEVVDRASTTELHHEPQLVVLAVRTFLDECAVIRGDVTMMGVLSQ